jgi:isopenicillin N synthase-like dioxygenase
VVDLRGGGPGEIHRATTKDSTFYVRNHGEESLVDDLLATAKRFFALPVEERQRLTALGPRESGYHASNDATEVLAVTRRDRGSLDLAGADTAGFPGDVRAAIERCLPAFFDLSMTILRSMAVGLGLDEESLVSCFADGALENLQLRHYVATRLRDEVPLDPHSDPPPLTLIAQDAVGGLESFLEGAWVPVTPIPATLVCQVGAIMSHWTDGRYAPSVHRVVSVENTDRCSVVYNLLPRADAAVACLPGLRTSAIPSSQPMTVGSFLERWLERARGYSTREAPDRSAPFDTRGDAEDVPLTQQFQEILRRASDGQVDSVDGPSARVVRTEEGLRIDLLVNGAAIALEAALCRAGRRYFRTFDGIGFWYRGQLQDQAMLTLVDRLVPLAGPLVAVALGRPAPRS